MLCARIAQRLERSVGAYRYGMWFDRSARLDYQDLDNRLKVAVPNRFVADWIGRNFDAHLRAAAREELGQDVDLSVYVDPAPFGEARSPRHGTDKDVAPRDGGGALAVPPRVRERRPQHFMPAPVLRYRLEDLVVGPNNELAVAAAQRLVSEDNPHASPLFIHGGVGLGKTHLLQGICRKMLDDKPDSQVHYTTGEQFTNEFLTAVRGGNSAIDAFRRKFRKLDLLAVDDVHFIANKTATQQEFLHSFKAIELIGARVVLASDAHPKMIQQFSEALVSRCVGGLVVEIKPPDTATKMRIIQALATRRGITLMESVAGVLAARCPGSVREIEGTLTKLQALATMEQNRCGGANGSLADVEHATIGHTLATRLFQADAAAAPDRPVRFAAIMAAVTRRLAMPREQIVKSGRQKQAVLARALVIHLARRLTGMSYPEIAAAMQRSSHSTVVTAEHRLRRQLEANEVVRLAIDSTIEEVALSALVEELVHSVRHTA